MQSEQRRNIKLISTAARQDSLNDSRKRGTKRENACINIEQRSTCPFTINHSRKKIVRRPVSRVLFPSRGDDHSSALRLATQLVRPTRMTRGNTRAAQGCPHPYSVLLQVGLAVPPSLRSGRCALTAPFHPYPPQPKRRRAVCSLLRFPWGHPRRALPGTLFPWSPDFPRSRRFRTCDRDRPAA